MNRKTKTGTKTVGLHLMQGCKYVLANTIKKDNILLRDWLWHSIVNFPSQDDNDQ